MDGAGNAYVVGYIGVNVSNNQCTLLKYSPEGELVWARYYPMYSVCYGLALDADDNLVVVGGYARINILAAKYTADGDLVWFDHYTVSGQYTPAARDVAVDADANAYVLAVTSQPGRLDDYTTIKYSPEGERLWVRYYDGFGLF
ncbi:MAG: hypothetical protein M5R36_26820 [Deltaproteobacteria bacterium]|nr:hypothetical protein [Deltaproteobacteria bacterium]